MSQSALRYETEWTPSKDISQNILSGDLYSNREPLQIATTGFQYRA